MGNMDAYRNFFQGGAGAKGHGERGARAYNCVLGRSPQYGPGAKPNIRESGKRSRLQLKDVKHLYA